MVISVLTMSCSASLAGEAQGWKRKAKTLPISWQSCHARVHSLCPPRLQLSVGQSQGRGGKAGMCWHRTLVLRVKETATETE